MAPVIEAKGLTKKYDRYTAVDNLDLKIEEGQIFGLLGPNGAGKTTAILMLTGLTEPTSGEASIGGFSTAHDSLKIKRITGYVPEKVGFYEDLTATYNLLYTARLNGIPNNQARASIAAALGKVGLKDKAEALVSTFSKGMKQRLGFAQAR